MTSSSDIVIYVVCCGIAWPLAWVGSEGMQEHVAALGPRDALDEALLMRPDGDGVFIATLGFVDDGPGDWPGTREYRLQALDIRPMSTVQWSAFVADEIVEVES